MGKQDDNRYNLRSIEGWSWGTGNGALGIQRSAPVALDLRGFRRLYGMAGMELGTGDVSDLWCGAEEAHRLVLSAIGRRARWDRQVMSVVEWTCRQLPQEHAGIALELHEGELVVLPVIAAADQHDCPEQPMPLDLVRAVPAGPRGLPNWQDWMGRRARDERKLLARSWNLLLTDLKLGRPAA